MPGSKGCNYVIKASYLYQALILILGYKNNTTLMKLIKLSMILVFMACGLPYNHAATASSAPLPVNNDPSTGSWQDLKLAMIVKLSPHSFSQLTGKKMSVKERIGFRLVKLKMKKALKKNPDMRAGEFFAMQKKMKTWLLVVIIVLGALLLAFLIFAMAYGGVI